jgi:hypothetical protein
MHGRCAWNPLAGFSLGLGAIMERPEAARETAAVAIPLQGRRTVYAGYFFFMALSMSWSCSCRP